MSVNKYKHHIVIIPEDDANRQIAVGFQIACNTAQIDIRELGKGWSKTVNAFIEQQIPMMRKYDKRHVILLIDFDNQTNRLDEIQIQIPEEFKLRTFIIGSLKTPEDVRNTLQLTFEKIGQTAFLDCNNSSSSFWSNAQLLHNEAELNRLKQVLCSVL